jgi:hypothetical protein
MRIVASVASIAGILTITGLSYAQATAPPAPTPSAEPGPAALPPDVPPAPGSTMNDTISAFGAVGYSYGFAVGLGLGARFEWVVVPKGFIHSLSAPMHDEFAIEPGFDYFHAGYSSLGVNLDYNEFTPLVGVLWNFWLNDKVAFYPKLDIGYRIASWSESVNGMSVGGAHADVFPVYVEGAAGAIYRAGSVSLRAEVGWEALRLGVGISL